MSFSLSNLTGKAAVTPSKAKLEFQAIKEFQPDYILIWVILEINNITSWNNNLLIIIYLWEREIKQPLSILKTCLQKKTK